MELIPSVITWTQCQSISQFYSKLISFSIEFSKQGTELLNQNQGTNMISVFSCIFQYFGYKTCWNWALSLLLKAPVNTGSTEDVSATTMMTGMWRNNVQKLVTGTVKWNWTLFGFFEFVAERTMSLEYVSGLLATKLLLCVYPKGSHAVKCNRWHQ